ncbi:hypothetical protein LCGC14_1049890 [marine sediment metagenome]|uniref:Transcription regulator TrmB N-terminal domain-containing protein n=1 Tax=marine sediment metagenome TaxID=412755 RepID=A0A0F9NB00_9ZZZZ|nr:hypothetical protein [bacterium]
MKDVITALENLIRSGGSNTLSAAIIEGKNNIVYSTENWDISNDIEGIHLAWGLPEIRTLKISELKYVVLQNTSNRLIAMTPNSSGGIIGFKDENRMIICKITPKGMEGMAKFGLMEASRAFGKLSSKKPYMEMDKQLGKVKELKWATPRILLDDTNNLQELGLLKFGLSIEEAKVYLALLKMGKDGAKVGQLDEFLPIKRTTIYRIIDRLIGKDWIVKLPMMAKSAQLFIARPLNDIFDERIQQKEEELKVLKSFRFIMGENLENGWIDLSDIKNDLQVYGQKSFDFKNLEIIGFDKDCGLIIFEYNKKIEDEVIIRAALQLSSEKLREPIQPNLDEKVFTILDLEDIKIEDIKIRDYLGMTMYFKFKEGTETGNNVGTEWIVATRNVAVPLENKIYIVWGSEENFPLLLSIILQL